MYTNLHIGGREISIASCGHGGHRPVQTAAVTVCITDRWIQQLCRVSPGGWMTYACLAAKNVPYASNKVGAEGDEHYELEQTKEESPADGELHIKQPVHKWIFEFLSQELSLYIISLQANSYHVWEQTQHILCMGILIKGLKWNDQ